LAALLAFGFGVISCGDGSVPDYSAPAAPTTPTTPGEVETEEIDITTTGGFALASDNKQFIMTGSGTGDTVEINAQLKAAVKIKFVAGETITGGLEMFFQGNGIDGTNVSWQTLSPLTGSAVPATGVEISEDKKTVTITTATFLTSEQKALLQNLKTDWWQFGFSYYSTDMTSLGGLSAIKVYLIVPKS
jgi:hypothetical protein